MIDKPKRKRRTKAEMVAARITKESAKGEPKGFNSLVGKKFNYDGKRAEVTTHYFNGKIEIQTKDGNIIKFDSFKAAKEA